MAIKNDGAGKQRKARRSSTNTFTVSKRFRLDGNPGLFTMFPEIDEILVQTIFILATEHLKGQKKTPIPKTLERKMYNILNTYNNEKRLFNTDNSFSELKDISDALATSI